MADRVSVLANEALNPKARIDAGDAVALSDAPLTIHKADRPKGWLAFMLKNSGGGSPRYFTKSEAMDSAVIAALKFVSAAGAGFTVGHFVYDAVASDAAKQAASIGPVSLSAAFGAAAFGAVFYGVSTFDTAVVAQMRKTKAARFFAANQDRFNINLDVTQDTQTSRLAMAMRYGISAASLGATLPWFLAIMSHSTLEARLRDQYNQQNAPLIQEQKNKLTAADGRIAELERQLADLQRTLASMQNPGADISSSQATRLETLDAQLRELARRRQEAEQRRAEQIQKRDDAEVRMRQEEGGIRGSTRGRGSLYATAKGDADDAKKNITTIEAEMARINEQMTQANTEIGQIRTEVAGATQTRNSELPARREATERQIVEVQKDLQRVRGVRDTLLDLEANAARDPRYRRFKPGVGEEIREYTNFMVNDASWSERANHFFIAMLLTCMELGVFMMAKVRNLNSGELRAYLANALKSEEALNKFEIESGRRVERLQNEITYDDVRKAMESETLRAMKDDYIQGLREDRSNPDSEYRQDLREHGFDIRALYRSQPQAAQRAPRSRIS